MQQFKGLVLFFPPAVVFFTPSSTIRERLGLEFQATLVEIFSPAPGISMLAQILTIEITVAYNKLLFWHLASTVIVLLDALPVINVPC